MDHLVAPRHADGGQEKYLGTCERLLLHTGTESASVKAPFTDALVQGG